MKNIHAYTENQAAPGYISINEESGYTTISVRTRGQESVSSIVMSREQLVDMHRSVAAYLSTTTKSSAKIVIINGVECMLHVDSISHAGLCAIAGKRVSDVPAVTYALKNGRHGNIAAGEFVEVEVDAVYSVISAGAA